MGPAELAACVEASVSGDQLPGVADAADGDRVEEAVLGDVVGEVGEVVGIEVEAAVLWVEGVNGVDRDGGQGLGRRRRRRVSGR